MGWVRSRQRGLDNMECVQKWWCIGYVSTNISYTKVRWWGQVIGQVMDGEWPEATTPCAPPRIWRRPWRLEIETHENSNKKRKLKEEKRNPRVFDEWWGSECDCNAFKLTWAVPRIQTNSVSLKSKTDYNQLVKKALQAKNPAAHILVDEAENDLVLLSAG